MDKDAHLQAQIAAISGSINQHKQHLQHSYTPSRPYQRGAGHHRGRWSPYARGGRAGFGRPYSNRTLVLGNQQPSSPDPNGVAPSNVTPTNPHALASSFVSARRPGANQIINKDTYQREQKQKQEHKNNARAVKRQKIDDEDRSSLIHHVETSTPGNRELAVDGIRFTLREDGSKLIRLPNPDNSKATPSKVKIANVDFHRTKNGNLVRANAIRDLLRYRQKDGRILADHNSNEFTSRKEKPQCEHFTKHGTCPYGPTCRFAHDPTKVAVCRTFLHKGSCAAGQSCDLSHELTYHRVPACVHFLRGNCINDACPYPHIRPNPVAPVCRPFALLGFCKKGDDCTNRHVSECPDYANHAKCDNSKCPLPHVDRASILRKAAAKQSKIGSEDESDVSSDEENQDGAPGIDDIDSDEAEDVIMGDDSNGHELTQQQDYIAF